MEFDIKTLCIEVYKNANKKGFWNDIEDLEWLKIGFKNPACEIDVNAISTRLMLIVGEVAEAQEGLRRNDRDNFKEELADVCIRMFDLCGGLDIDLESEILKKMSINLERPYLHGKLF